MQQGGGKVVRYGEKRLLVPGGAGRGYLGSRTWLVSHRINNLRVLVRLYMFPLCAMQGTMQTYPRPSSRTTSSWRAGARGASGANKQPGPRRQGRGPSFPVAEKRRLL